MIAGAGSLRQIKVIKRGSDMTPTPDIPLSIPVLQRWS